MNSLVAQALLAAERSRVDDLAGQMANGFRSDRVRFDPAAWLPMLTLAAALMALAWLAARIVAAWRRRSGSPGRLFFDLCRAHRLGWSDRWLLWRLARRRGLKEPARLFLEPQQFEGGDGKPFPDEQTSRLAALRERLFAGLENLAAS